MPLQSSGAISLNEMHIEAGGSSGTQASINDSDIRGLVGTSSGTSIGFSEFYGASALTNYAYGWVDDIMANNNNSTHGAGETSVFNIWYKRTLFAYTITQSELENMGIFDGATIDGIRWWMTNAPVNRPYPSYQVALCNMPSNTTQYNPTISSNRNSFSSVISTQNWDVGSSVPKWTGWSQSTFSSFSYTGGNLGIIVAWGAVSNYNQSGICSTTSGTSWYSWTDSAGTYSTSNTASSTRSYRPRTSLRVNSSGNNYLYFPRYTTTTSGSVYMGNSGSITKDLNTGTSHNFPDYGHPETTGLSLTSSAYRFNDWGNDIWDNWGFFHLWITGGHYFALDLSGGNLGDGAFTARNIKYIYTTPNPEFYIKFGHPVANGWMLHIRCKQPSLVWRLCMGGNMGSDGNTYTRNGYTTITMNSGGTRNIWNRENSDNSSYNSAEQVRWWIIPMRGNETIDSSSSHYYGVSGDNHYISSPRISGGLTLYMSKGNSILPSSQWVGYDLDGESGAV